MISQVMSITVILRGKRAPIASSSNLIDIFEMHNIRKLLDYKWVTIR